MTGIWFEDVVDIGPDGQTQEGLCACYTKRDDAEACLPLLELEFENLRFTLVDDPVPIDPTLNELVEWMRWGEYSR